MEATIISTVASLSAATNVILGFYIYKYQNNRSLIKEAPDIFVEEIGNNEAFLKLNSGFKEKLYYILKFVSKKNESTQKNIIQLEVNTVKAQDTKINGNMVYIHIANKNMYGAELKIMDPNGVQIIITDDSLKYLSVNQRVGMLFNHYEQPYKIYVIYQGNKFEYDVNNIEGSIKINMKKIKKNKNEK